VRDGRASVYSLLKYLNKSIDKKNFNDYLIKWNEFNREAYDQCQKIGKKLCFMQRYEDLVTNNESSLQSLAKFLNISYQIQMINHEKYVGSGKVILEVGGWSTGDFESFHDLFIQINFLIHAK
jgi:hypothetical protein